jgi:hypothetical protein
VIGDWSYTAANKEMPDVANPPEVGKRWGGLSCRFQKDPGPADTLISNF